MTTKRRAIDRGQRLRLTPELRAKVERVLELSEDHILAIRGGGPQSFYEDGRHEELCALGSEVRAALQIKPWHDEVAMLRAALGVDEA